MGPLQATFRCLTHPFTWDARASRSEYWGFVLVYVLASIGTVLYLMIPALAPFQHLVATGDDAPLQAALDDLQSQFNIMTLAFLWPGLAYLAVSIRRLHDTGRSGWWYLIQLVPLIGALWFLVLTILGSERRNNQWGPPPSGPATDTAKARKPRGLDAYMPEKSEIDRHDTPEAIRALRLSRMQST